MGRGAWWATVHGVAESWPWLNAHTHTHTERWEDGGFRHRRLVLSATHLLHALISLFLFVKSGLCSRWTLQSLLAPRSLLCPVPSSLTWSFHLSRTASLTICAYPGFQCRWNLESKEKEEGGKKHLKSKWMGKGLSRMSSWVCFEIP